LSSAPNSPTLILPKRLSPSSGWDEKPQAPARPAKRPKVAEHPGRDFGEVAGSYIDGLVARAKTIWLCWSCRHKFDHASAHYFYEKNLRVTGRCDGCREHRPDSHLFIHESLLCDSGGKIRHGLVWTPRNG